MDSSVFYEVLFQINIRLRRIYHSKTTPSFAVVNSNNLKTFNSDFPFSFA